MIGARIIKQDIAVITPGQVTLSFSVGLQVIAVDQLGYKENGRAVDLEVITHKDRVIDISPDVDVFKIYKDNNTYEEVEKALKDKVWKVPKKKKWWQFW